MTKDEICYYIYLKSYINTMMKNDKYKDLKDYDTYHVLFPKHWLDINDYSGKIELMKEAIEKNKNIREINGSEKYEHILTFSFEEKENILK